MKNNDIDKLIKLNEEKEEYLKNWIMYGIFGYQKKIEGHTKTAISYFLMIFGSLICFSLAIFYSMENLIKDQSWNSVAYLALSGLILYVIVTTLWVNDLLKATKEFDEKIEHLKKEKL